MFLPWTAYLHCVSTCASGANFDWWMVYYTPYSPSIDKQTPEVQKESNKKRGEGVYIGIVNRQFKERNRKEEKWDNIKQRKKGRLLVLEEDCQTERHRVRMLRLIKHRLLSATIHYKQSDWWSQEPVQKSRRALNTGDSFSMCCANVN